MVGYVFCHFWWCCKREGALPDCGARDRLHKIATTSHPQSRVFSRLLKVHLPCTFFQVLQVVFPMIPLFSWADLIACKYCYERWSRKSHKEESEKTNTEDAGVQDQLNSISCPFKFNCTHHRLVLALLNIRLLVYICDLSPKWLDFVPSAPFGLHHFLRYAKINMNSTDILRLTPLRAECDLSSQMHY